MNVKKLILAITLMSAASCSSNADRSDAYGNFESTEIVISAEATGKLLRFDVEEGSTIEAGAVIGYIDTVQLALKREQLLATQQSVGSKSANVLAQIDVVQEQKKTSRSSKNSVWKNYSKKMRQHRNSLTT